MLRKFSLILLLAWFFSGCESMKYSCFLKESKLHEHEITEEADDYRLTINVPTGSTFGSDAKKPMVHIVRASIVNKLERPADLVFHEIVLISPDIRPISKLETYLPNEGDNYTISKTYNWDETEKLVIDLSLDGKKFSDEVTLFRRNGIDWNDGKAVTRYETAEGKRVLEWNEGSCHARIQFPMMDENPVAGDWEHSVRLKIYNQKWIGSKPCQAAIREFALKGKDPVRKTGFSRSGNWEPESLGATLQLKPAGENGSSEDVIQRFIVQPTAVESRLRVTFSFDGKEEKFEVPLYRDIETNYVDGCISNFKETG